MPPPGQLAALDDFVGNGLELDDFVALGKEPKGELTEGTFFTENMGILEPRLQTWLRGRGKGLDDAEEQLAHDEQDLAD